MAIYKDAEQMLQQIKESASSWEKKLSRNRRLYFIKLKNSIIKLITNAPAADVVKVTRCENCYLCEEIDDLDGGHWECIAYYNHNGQPYLPDPHGFCHQGRPRSQKEEIEKEINNHELGNKY